MKVMFKDKEIKNPILKRILAYPTVGLGIIFVSIALMLIPVFILIDIPLKILGFKGIVKYE